MCTIAQALEDRGIMKGRTEGRQEGGIEKIYSLLNKKIITQDIAAEELNVSVNDLEKLFKKYGLGSN